MNEVESENSWDGDDACYFYGGYTGRGTVLGPDATEFDADLTGYTDLSWAGASNEFYNPLAYNFRWMTLNLLVCSVAGKADDEEGYVFVPFRN